MDPVKVGVLGAGYWGPNLIRNYYQIEETQLQVVCDLRPDRLEHIKSLYPEVCTTSSFEEFLASDIEAVSIATPVSTHFQLAMQCLKAGKHVLIEKPIARNSSEALEIIQTGQELGKVVMVGHTFVYSPAVEALKEIISRGEIGDIYYISSTRGNLGLYQPDINVVWDLAPHDISILMYILGKDPLTASARGGMYVKKGVHDMANLTIYFPDNIIADLRVSWLDPNKVRYITIVGSKKMIVYNDIEEVNKVKVYDKGVDIQPYNDTFEEFKLAYHYGDVLNYPLRLEEPLKAECKHFVKCIRNGQHPRSDGEQGLKVTRVLEAAQKSLFNGGVQEKIAWQTMMGAKK